MAPAPAFLTVPLEPSWDSLAWAGVLLGGQFARLGPVVGVCTNCFEAPDPLDVLVPRERRVDVDGPWRFIRETPGARPARSVKDPPRLTVESTVLDLTDVRDAGEVVGLITTAIQRRRTQSEGFAGSLTSGRVTGIAHYCGTCSSTLALERSRLSNCAICATSSVRTACQGVIDSSQGQASLTRLMSTIKNSE